MRSEPGNRSADSVPCGRGLLAAALVFLGLGVGLAALTCWQESRPAEALPGVGAWALRWLGPDMLEGGALSPDLLRALGTLAGVLLTWVALVPLQIGGAGLRSWDRASRRPFPCLARRAGYLGIAGGLALVASYFVPGGPARAGWVAYLPPLEVVPGSWRFDAQTLGLLGWGLLGLSLLFAAVTALADIGRPWGFALVRTCSWFERGQGLAAWWLLIGVPVALAVVALQLMDNVLGSRLLASFLVWPEPAKCLWGLMVVLLLVPSVGLALDILPGPSPESPGAPVRPPAARWFAAAILVGAGLTLLAGMAHGVRGSLPVAAGVAFCAVNARFYALFPVLSGRWLNEFWGKVHCVLSLLYLGLLLLPGRFSGGGGTVVADSQIATARFHALWMLALAQAPLGVNWLWSRRQGPPVTLARSGVVTASAGVEDVADNGGWPGYSRRFLVATILGFFALVFFALRVRAVSDDWRLDLPGGTLATFGMLALAASGVTWWLARTAGRNGRPGRSRLLAGVTVLLGLSFLAGRGWEYCDRLTHDFVRLTDGRELVGRVVGQGLDRTPPSESGTLTGRFIRFQHGSSSAEFALLPVDDVELLESLGPWRSRALAIWFLLTGLHTLLVIAGLLLLVRHSMARSGGASDAPARSPWLRPAAADWWVAATAMGVVLWVVFAV